MVSKTDDIFNILVFGFFAVLLFGTVTRIENVIYLFGSEDKTVTDIALSLLYIGLMLFALFYTIKETSDINDHSSQTKQLLYDYILSTDPQQRNSEFNEEVIDS